MAIPKLKLPLNGLTCIFLSCLFHVNSALPIIPLHDTTLTGTPTASASQSGGNPKFVFAHHIIGNTFNFTPSIWLNDITMAHAAGIDGFALNVGNQPWEPSQVRSAYDAAQASGKLFKMFLSLDMTSLPCASPSDAQKLVALVNSQNSHPSQFRYGSGNKTFVSTFSGEACTFSSPSPSRGWAQHFVEPLGPDIHFVPAFFVDVSQLSAGNAEGDGGFGGIISGDFNWNSGWPTQVTTAALRQSATDPATLASLLNLNASSVVQMPSGPGLSGILKRSLFARSVLAAVSGAFTSDELHLKAIKGRSQNKNQKSGMPTANHYTTVSPWFFTHYSPQTFNKNFLFLSDNHLYSRRWETLVDSRDAVDLVEIVTWNDYGESHYVGPIEGTQPNSQAWVDGNDHTGWLDLTAYYAHAFKTGVYPTVTRDKIVMWARPHARDAEASGDDVARPTNFQLTEDSLWATVLVPAPSTVVLSVAPQSSNASPISLSSGVNSTTSKVFDVPAGASHLKIPLIVNGGMRAAVFRNNELVLDFSPGGFTFDSSPKTFNFNAFAAASP
ncbi:glycoside hydrolase family 71 protein [Hysterangium stoloniferum]|nr:glycoside hydrolase family 71 protein [Hysterangium stoloniferum]